MITKMNCERSWNKSYHLTSTLLPHYLVTFECSASYLSFLWSTIIYAALFAIFSKNSRYSCLMDLSLSYFSRCWYFIVVKHYNSTCWHVCWLVATCDRCYHWPVAWRALPRTDIFTHAVNCSLYTCEREVVVFVRHLLHVNDFASVLSRVTVIMKGT